MGYAARSNPNSMWNKKRNTTKFSKTPTPVQGESTVIELSPKTFFTFLKDFVCRMLSPLTGNRRSASPAPTS